MITLLMVSVLQSIHSYAMEHEEAEYATIIIDNEVVSFQQSLDMQDGRLFAPAREVVDYFFGQIDWDGELRQVTVTTYFGDVVVLTIDSHELLFNGVPYVMDVAPYIMNSTTYVPIRHLAEFLHADVSWDAQERVATFSPVPLYVMTEVEELTTLAERFDVLPELLAERNELAVDVDEPSELAVGSILKHVIPTIMANKLTLEDVLKVEEEVEEEVAPEPHPDLELLAKLIHAEAGWEPYEGQVAVGSVIMNRLESERFAAQTIYDVIYAPNQFTPAVNGTLESIVPNESSWKAAEAVLNGENNVEGALFFYNPNNTPNKSYWNTLTLVKEIGNHHFLK